MSLKMLFAEVGKYWAPKPRSRRSSKDLDTPGEPDVSGAGAEGNAVEDGEADEDCETKPDEIEDSHTPDEEINGVSTPPSSKSLNDEYLAWTLGGGLRKTASPCSPWVPDTPEEKEELQRDMDLVRIDNKIAELENLRCLNEFCFCKVSINCLQLQLATTGELFFSVPQSFILKQDLSKDP